jgi:DNA invertase Pin-like site-specific DNA recombinase
MAKPIPAVACIRMSTDTQDMSPQQQRAAIADLARQNGYEIIREYLDEGKSGSKDLKKRTGFLKMVEDSAKRDFKVVLCWDVARFSRLDPLKAAGFKDTLRDNGIYLHTCKEGKIEWNRIDQFIVDVVYAATAHEYSKSLSKDSIRGRVDSILSGNWANGKVPIGYDRLYIDPDGNEYPVARLARFAKPRNWRKQLVINETEADLVRWIFAEFLNNDLSLREIARRIKAPRPNGKPGAWTKNAVAEVLSNKAYAGYAYVGANKNAYRESLNKIDYVECAGAIPAIIGIKDWESAQAKLDHNKAVKARVQPGKSSPLSGIMFCGHCGYALGKHEYKNKRTGEKTAYFSCSSGTVRPSLGCRQWSVTEAEYLPLIIANLIREVDEAVVEALNASPTDADRADDPLSAKKAELTALIKRLDQAEADFLGTPRGPRKDRQKAIIQQWESEQAELERQIANLSMTEGDISKFAKWWESVRGDLVTVRPIVWGNPHTVEWGDGTTQKVEEPIQAAVMVEGDRFRNLLKSLGVKVAVWWRPRESRPGTYEVDHAELTINGKSSTHTMAPCARRSGSAPAGGPTRRTACRR